MPVIFAGTPDILSKNKFYDKKILKILKSCESWFIQKGT
ncbi:Uncharacterized protein dnl_02750 [Desulfonema limicola]|uniref:Uncharacterized protein n=1 Tax=Desulfonema limicola TaxID=45656 RepID=A0A975B3E3_9BACT|nr:Uncharacterized protein dnl_02750 [Desulfonema limicola]